MTKSCGKCRWFQGLREDENGRVLGSCLWANERFPWSLRFVNDKRVLVYSDEGTDCACFLARGAETFAEAGFKLRIEKDKSGWFRSLDESENTYIVITNSDGDHHELQYEGDYWVVGFHLSDKVILRGAFSPEEALMAAEEFTASLSLIH